MKPGSSDTLSLAAEFPPATRAEWRALVDGVLKGAPFDKKLVSRTYDHLAIEPIYSRAAHAPVVAGRGAAEPWLISQRLDHAEPDQVNAQALDDLENGATALALVCCGGVGAHGLGLPEAASDTLAQALAGVVLDAGVLIELFPVFGSGDVAMAFDEVVARRGVDPARVRVHFNHEPLAVMAVRGYAAAPWPELAEALAQHVNALKLRGYGGPFVLADGRPVHDAGGSEAQELAFVLASAVAYLRALEGGGMALADARAAIAFRLAADADQFLTIAKFRALRKLWARVETACGLSPQPAFVGAETAWRMLTRRDPYVNMLRATMAAFAAGLGGANSVTVLPHTLALGLPDAMARRAARNTQLILLEESNLARVADPAAGSGGIEHLTAGLCEAAWLLFQEIEQAGGAGAALEGGLIARKVLAVQAERAANVVRRRDALTGASEFPDIHEAPVPVLGSRLIGTAHGGAAVVKFDAIKPMRLAEPFEKLRDASDRLLKADGTRPRVFLAALGGAADFTARVTFAKNFFEAGGIEAVGGEAFDSLDELADACAASGAAFACLCSSDAVYAREAEGAARALTEAGVRHLYLAGRAGEQEAALRAAGIGTFIHAGCDVLAVLQAAHTLLEA
ncbi:MAG: methylmalonyl-CoA mutase [Xanthobacteraceae bacterium]|nr:MAG: methylmalonyl-CoA mutase [Xanthobacteraceae bacterium]